MEAFVSPWISLTDLLMLSECKQVNNDMNAHNVLIKHQELYVLHHAEEEEEEE